MTLVDLIRQMIEQAVTSAVISSAGGDSPKKNYVMAVDINPVDFDSILNDEVRTLINDAMEERELAVFQNKKTPIKEADPAKEVLSLVGGNLGASPTSIVSMLIPMLGPAMLVFLLPQIIKFVIGELIKPGGVFDTRFRREVEKEQFGFYNRQMQYDSQHGYRNVIIQGVNGFKKDQGSFHASAFRDITEGYGNQYRLSRIGLTDKAQGFKDY